MNLKDIQKKIQRGEIKIEYAKRTRTETLRPWISKVLEAVGHPEAFVTDKSTVSDFFSMDDRAGKAEEISKKLGVTLKLSDYIIDVANRIRTGGMV